MQTLSHGTRAYIVNADGLTGFVLPYDIANHLKTADEAGQLEHARRYHEIDMSIVCQKLATRDSPQKKLDFLGEEYPSLHVFILEHFKLHGKIEQYMAKCKKLPSDSSNEKTG